MTSSHLERDAPSDARGGLGKRHPLFGDPMDALIDELDRELVA